MSVWSSIEFEKWLSAGQPVEKYLDADGNIVDPVDVVHLNLENPITRDCATSIGKLENLQYLKISQYSGKTLPACFATLYNLQFLAISSDGRADSLEEFPSEICNLTTLEDLKLCGHSFTRLDSVIGNLENLYTLDLSNNMIQEIPETLTALKHLQKLYLSGNSIVDLNLVFRINSLQIVDLCEVGMFLYKEETVRFPECLVKLIHDDSLPLVFKNRWSELNPDYPKLISAINTKLYQQIVDLMEEELVNSRK